MKLPSAVHGLTTISHKILSLILSFSLVFISAPSNSFADLTESLESSNRLNQPTVEAGAASENISDPSLSYPVLFPDEGKVLFEAEEEPESELAAGDTGDLAAGTEMGNQLRAAGGPSKTDTKAPRISNIFVSSLSASSVSIQWKTSEPSTAQVVYGVTTNYGSSSPLDTALTTTHTVVLNNLTAETAYHYQLLSRDAAGNLARSSDLVFTTLKAPDSVGPVISAVSASNITRTGVTISWNTNETSDTQIEYGTTTSYGSMSTLNTALVTAHTQSLSNLQAGLTYHYRVRSKDQFGNLTLSQDYTFRTLDPDTTAPVISQVTTANVESLQFTVNWITDELSDTQVEYGTTDAYGNLTTLNTTRVTSHSQTITGLQASTVYHFRVRSKDADGNLSYSADYTVTTLQADVTPPTISAVATSSVLSTKFTVSWTTNEASDTQVEFGPTAAYGSKTTLNTTLATTHSATVTGLSPDTEYHFRVLSKDKYGNLSASQDYIVRTINNMPPTIAAINLNQLDADYARAGYQVFQASPWTKITYSAKLSDPEGDVVSWQWLYRYNGGAETFFNQGTGLTASAVIDYVSMQAGNYEWILRAASGGQTSEQRFTTEVLQGSWASSITPTIFLDFDGNFIQQWGSYSNITTPRFDQDGDFTGFSWSEIVEAGKVLMSVAEKFSPFNIGVSVFDYFFGNYATREEEAAARYSFYEQNKIMQVAIGGNSNWAGGNYGGIAYTNNYSSTMPNLVFAFEDNVASNAKYIGEVSAHEVGHAFGLGHQSLYDANGVKTAEYYKGTSAWAPIMGSSYYAARSTWWTGEGNEPASMRTDEVATIARSANGFGFRPDDHGAAMDSASALTLAGTAVSGKGIIEQLTDKDYFKFTTTTAGSVSFTGKVAQYGTMLDLALELRDSSGNLLATQDTSALGETLTMSLAAGTYYLVIRSHGRYGDLGQYWITGTVPSGTTSTAGPNALAGARDVFSHTKVSQPIYSGAGSLPGSSALPRQEADKFPDLSGTDDGHSHDEDVKGKRPEFVPSASPDKPRAAELVVTEFTPAKSAEAELLDRLLEIEAHVPFNQEIRVNSQAAAQWARLAVSAARSVKSVKRITADSVKSSNRALKTQELISGVKTGANNRF